MVPERICQQYEVGTCLFTIVDDSRKEVLGSGTGNRKIPVRLYYPVTKDSVIGKKKVDYVSEKKMELLRKAYHIPKSVKKPEPVPIYEDVPMIEDERFPLVLYSHGYNAYMESNTYLCMELASSGYIVASIGHSYEAICTEYEDGSSVVYDKKINKIMYKTGVLRVLLAQSKLLKKKGSIEEMAEDFQKLMEEHTPYFVGRVQEWSCDTLCALKEIKRRFADYLDLSNGVAATGHSLGGAVAYNLCLTSDEISCGLNMDGGLFVDNRNLTLTKPFFQLSCKENWNVESSILLRRKAPVYCAVFDNMKHIGFTDAKFFFPVSFLVGKMDATKLHKYETKFHLFLLDKYLKKQEVEDLTVDDAEIKLLRYVD